MDKHEISVNGHMFDINSKKLENGIYTFTGLYDDDETELIQKQESTEKDKQQNKLLTQFFKSLPVFCNQYDTSDNPPLLSNCYIALASQNPIKQFQKISTPPPQVIAILFTKA